jgi:hypothetical protein
MILRCLVVVTSMCTTALAVFDSREAGVMVRGEEEYDPCR